MFIMWARRLLTSPFITGYFFGEIVKVPDVISLHSFRLMKEERQMQVLSRDMASQIVNMSL